MSSGRAKRWQAARGACNRLRRVLLRMGSHRPCSEGSQCPAGTRAGRLPPPLLLQSPDRHRHLRSPAPTLAPTPSTRQTPTSPCRRTAGGRSQARANPAAAPTRARAAVDRGGAALGSRGQRGGEAHLAQWPRCRTSMRARSCVRAGWGKGQGLMGCPTVRDGALRTPPAFRLHKQWRRTHSGAPSLCMLLQCVPKGDEQCAPERHAPALSAALSPLHKPTGTAPLPRLPCSP